MISEIPCDYCTMIFHRKPSHIARNTHNFCSKACADNFRRNKVDLICECCGKVYTRIPSKASRSLLHFCSRLCSFKYQVKSRHSNWKGGITPKNQADRGSKEYSAWRSKVFSRDSYTCQKCGNIGHSLQAHHIIGWASNKPKRYLVTNGSTLCKDCHSGFHTLYGLKTFTSDNYWEWLYD